MCPWVALQDSKDRYSIKSHSDNLGKSYSGYTPFDKKIFSSTRPTHAQGALLPHRYMGYPTSMRHYFCGLSMPPSCSRHCFS